MQEKQQREQGSSRQQEFQHQIGAEFSAPSTQHSQNTGGYSHFRLPLFLDGPTPPSLHEVVEWTSPGIDIYFYLASKAARVKLDWRMAFPPGVLFVEQFQHGGLARA